MYLNQFGFHDTFVDQKIRKYQMISKIAPNVQSKEGMEMHVYQVIFRVVGENKKNIITGTYKCS